MIQQSSLTGQISRLVQRQPEEDEEEEEPIQLKSTGGEISLLQLQEKEPGATAEIEEEEEPGNEAGPLARPKRYSRDTSQISGPVAQNIESLRGGGSPLPDSVRSFFEPKFGYDFSGVRIHTGSGAVKMARAVKARAFTTGKDIIFGSGQHAPESIEAKKLLAHELTHVVQQNGNSALMRKNPRKQSGLTSPLSISSLLNRSHSIQRSVEVHVNLRYGGRGPSRRNQSVKVYQSSDSDMEFITSAGTGDRTSRLIRRPHYPILAKVGPPPAKTSAWGLQYFCQVTGGGIGFHSNIAFPKRRTLCADGVRSYCGPPADQRVRRTLVVDGTPRSHGCIRLHHGNARRLFNAVNVGTRVYIYDRLNWRSPSWSSAPDRALP